MSSLTRLEKISAEMRWLVFVLILPEGNESGDYSGPEDEGEGDTGNLPVPSLNLKLNFITAGVFLRELSPLFSLPRDVVKLSTL